MTDDHRDLFRFLGKIEDQRRVPSLDPLRDPAYSRANHWITEAAVVLRELTAAPAKAQALAAEIEEYQAAAGIRGPAAQPGFEVWQLAPGCWAELLIHGPRAPRRFLVPDGGDALVYARRLWLEPFGGFVVERVEG